MSFRKTVDRLKKSFAGIYVLKQRIGAFNALVEAVSNLDFREETLRRQGRKKAKPTYII